jgi:hypothetical protein
MRFFALDVHRDFCEVAIAENGQVRRAGRVETSPATLELFARSLAADDQVVLEATGNALAIARIIGRMSAALCSPTRRRSRTRPEGEDGQARRAHAREAARGRLPPGGLDAGRADARPASADLPPRAAGAAAHPREEHRCTRS